MSGKTLVEDRFMTLMPLFVLFILRGVVVVVFPDIIVVVVIPGIIVVVVIPGIIVVVVIPGIIVVVVIPGIIVVVLPDESARLAISLQASPRELAIASELLSVLNVMLMEKLLIDAVNEYPLG